MKTSREVQNKSAELNHYLLKPAVEPHKARRIVLEIAEDIFLLDPSVQKTNNISMPTTYSYPISSGNIFFTNLLKNADVLTNQIWMNY
jgi:hypothetical protein